jgi:hypothetical protein
VATVSDHDLPGGRLSNDLQVGLFAKTWDPQVGGAANVDFAYFGRAQDHAQQVSDPAPQASAEVDAGAPRTFCVSGKERMVLNGYREAELLRQTGKGCLTHMWFGGDWPGYDKTRIRIYVDGQQQPSIDMQLGLGHGFGFGDKAAPWGSEKLGKTGDPSGVYNTYKVPYGQSIRVTAQRNPDSPDGAPFWWIVRGTENLPVAVAGIPLPAVARLKLYKLEDYFLGTYYFNRGRYANALAGLTHLDTRDNTFSAYRSHDNDPIFFRKGLRLTCRCGEEIGGQKLHDPPPTRFTTYTWVYQW